MLRVCVCVSGGGTNLQAIIDAVAEHKITNTEIALVISNHESAKALERAQKSGIKTACFNPKSYESKDLYEEALIEAVEKEQIDLVVLAGFMIMIPVVFIQKYRNRIINIHPSLIPSFCGPGYYGLRVHEKALEKGVKVTGATVHFVDEIYDNGPIMMQKSVMVRDDDTPQTLQLRVMQEAEWNILPKAIDLIANNKVRIVNGKVIIEE
jgi:phosphoribosylglycinamide formyltransferase-1